MGHHSGSDHADHWHSSNNKMDKMKWKKVFIAKVGLGMAIASFAVAPFIPWFYGTILLVFVFFYNFIGLMMSVT